MEYTIGATESVSAVVRRAVSTVTGRHPDSIPPLGAVLDPDALDALFAPRSDGVPRTGGRVSFIYSHCRITVDNGEFLTIEPIGTTGLRSAASNGAERDHTDREPHHTGPTGAPGSRICFVCQQPIDRENLVRERGELVHPHCRAIRRYGISLDTVADRS